jgi:hypothetical protein
MDHSSPFEERAQAIVNKVWGGDHHLRKLIKHEGKYPYWEITPNGQLSTYDFNGLTLLVLAAHEYAIRASVEPHTFSTLKVKLWCRQRDGAWDVRHPTIERAIGSFREGGNIRSAPIE